MLHILTEYAVPACLFILMLIAGTEINVAGFIHLHRNIRAVLLGAVGQLLTLPLTVLVIHAVISLHPVVSLGTLLLSLCPNGGISNYYVYLARCNIPLSATITAAGTLASLITIPLWLQILPNLSEVASEFAGVPAKTVLAQLTALMVLPMTIGMLLRHKFSERIERAAKLLRGFLIVVVMLVLAFAIGTVAMQLVGYVGDIILASILFIACGMLLGWGLGYGLAARDRPVLAIEGGVRNVAVALIMGNAMLSKDNFGVFASFLTGYFIIEMIVMLAYARYQARQLNPKSCALG